MLKKRKVTQLTKKVAKGVGKEAVQIGKGVAKEGGKIVVGAFKGFLDVFSPFR
jgi:hypothetical protein